MTATIATPAPPLPAMRARDPGRVLVFDTTLRDGEQSPGASLNLEEKLVIAQQLARLGVDVIEAGFPFASAGDFDAVQRIAGSVGTSDGPIICGLSRAARGDIEACAKAVAPAARSRIHTFIATSDIHLEYKLRKSRREVLEIVPEMVALAASLCDDVEFSCEDAARSDPEFLYEVIEAAIAAGATTINIPDTVGYTTPGEFHALVAGIDAQVPNIHQAVLSVHGHNDLGLAVANFLAAIQAGARQLECTVNGIGERAGNAALEELVMALHVRRQLFNTAMGRPAESETPLTAVKTEEIYRTSRLVANLTGMFVQPNKAIVGANAFAHESGIHQDGVLKNRITYEIMDARLIGLRRNRISLGKLSGRNAFRARLEELGYTLEPEDLTEAFHRFKDLADRKRDVTDRDLESIVSDHTQQVNATYTLKLVQVSCGTNLCPTATVTLVDSEGHESTTAATGTGPVDAVCRAIDALVDVPNELVEFSIQAVTEGIDALGRVTIRLRQGDLLRSGYSADTDVVVASAQAFLGAINRLIATKQSGTRAHAQG